MAIMKGSEWAIKNFYLDDDFEEVMFRWDCVDKKQYRKFYGETQESSIPHDNKLINNAMLYGKEISKEEYDAGKL